MVFIIKSRTPPLWISALRYMDFEYLQNKGGGMLGGKWLICLEVLMTFAINYFVAACDVSLKTS